MAPPIIHYYRKTEPPHSLLPSVKEQLKAAGFDEDVEHLNGVETESCFNILLTSEPSGIESSRLEWLLAETFEKDNLQLEESALSGDVMEFGPRMTFTSAFSSNAVGICQACNLPVERCELSLRYKFLVSSPLSEDALRAIKGMLHDRMTQEEYAEPITTFDSGASAEPVQTIPILAEGRPALEKINAERGLGFDDFDLEYYTKLFKVRVRRSHLFPPVLCSCYQPCCLHRINWAVIQLMLNALIWASLIRNTLVIGSLEGRWSLMARRRS